MPAGHPTTDQELIDAINALILLMEKYNAKDQFVSDEIHKTMIDLQDIVRYVVEDGWKVKDAG